MLIDYHTHHARCGHATGNLEDYVKRGIEIGLTQLGLSDHIPLIHVDPEAYLPGMAMAMEELPDYVDEAFSLKEKYKDQIDIRVGLEADYIEGYEEQIAAIINRYPWDYVIGSVHFLGTWDVSDHRQLDGWNGRQVDDVFREYYEAVQKAAKSQLYDFLGHIDMIKRFRYMPTGDMTGVERETLDIIKAHNMAIELNASGLRHTANQMYPCPSMLAYACEIGIPITIGSDAHQPDRLAENLDLALLELKKAGYLQIATFCSRERLLIPF